MFGDNSGGSPGSEPCDHVLREADRDAAADFLRYRERYIASFEAMRGDFRARFQHRRSNVPRAPGTSAPDARNSRVVSPPAAGEGGEALSCALDALRQREVPIGIRGRSELAITLLRGCWDSAGDLADRLPENKWLATVGMRAVRACSGDGQPPVCRCSSCTGPSLQSVPRCGPSAGVWLLPDAMRALFRGVPGLSGEQWQIELLRVGARSPKAVRVDGRSVKAIWLPREAIDDGGGSASMINDVTS